MEWASIIFRVLRADSGHGDSSLAERKGSILSLPWNHSWLPLVSDDQQSGDPFDGRPRWTHRRDGDRSARGILDRPVLAVLLVSTLPLCCLP
jgi:hypothetical protein